MTRKTVVVRSDVDRAEAANLCRSVPVGSRIEFKQERRSLDQNSKLWACLADVAEQLPWHGKMLTSDDWKQLFLNALKRSMMVPNLDETGFVTLGQSSSDLSVSEMSDLIELILAFGANHGVKFHDDEDSSEATGPLAADRMDTPAASEQTPQTTMAAAGVTISNSPEHMESGRADTSAAASSPLLPAAAGVPVSALWHGWREIYLDMLTGSRDRPESIKTRDTNARPLLGGIPNQHEEQWIGLAQAEVTRWRKGGMQPGEWERVKANLIKMPLPKVEKAA